MEKFIKANKIFFAIWSIWMLINFALWTSGGASFEKARFYPDTYKTFHTSHSSIGETWNFPEVLIYGFGPLLLFIIYKTVIKENKRQ